MQPVLLYRPQTYPPRGAEWPHFGDDALQQTLSATQEAHQNLESKRQHMMPHHQETLAYHGLAPNTEYYDMSDQTEDQDTQTETNTMGQGTQTEINTVSQGIGTEYTSRSQGTETENSSPMDTTTETGTQAAMAPWWGPIRRYKPPVRSSPLQGTQVAVRQAGVTIQAMDDDAATVDYEFLEAEERR